MGEGRKPAAGDKPKGEKPEVKTPEKKVREKVKKVGNVLKTQVKVDRLTVVKKGTILKTSEVNTVNKIISTNPQAIEYITPQTIKLKEDVQVMKGERLPVGTKLDPVADKELIAELNANDPNALGEANE